jgi:hypothetical protein
VEPNLPTYLHPHLSISQPLSTSEPNRPPTHPQPTHQALIAHIASERHRVAAALQSGPLCAAQSAANDLAGRLLAAQSDLEAVQHGRDADAIGFDDLLRRCRAECSEGAEAARQESLAMLRGEVAQLKVRGAL